MSSTPTLPIPASNPIQNLLSQAHPPAQVIQVYNSKIKGKPLLLHPTPRDSRALRRKVRERKRQYQIQHQRPRPLSAKQKRALKVYDLAPEEVKYSIYKGLNEMWKEYILEVLGFTRDGEIAPDVKSRVVAPSGHGSLIASADFHGMEVEVVKCVDPGRVGLKGIVVRETKGTILVVTEQDQQRTILKRGAVFRVVVELPGGSEEKKRNMVVELQGSRLEIRPVDRAIKQFKWHPDVYLGVRGKQLA